MSKLSITLSPSHLVTLSHHQLVALLHTLLLLLLTLAMLGCTNRSSSGSIWCGHVANLTGSEKKAGDAAGRGIRLAVEEINKDTDASDEAKWKVIHSDARGNLEAIEAEAIRLVSVNRVSFLLGGTTTEEVERLDRAGVTVLTPLGQHSRTMSDGVFCLGLSPTRQGKALAKFAVESGLSNVLMVLDAQVVQAEEIASAFESEFKAAWMKKNDKAGASRSPSNPVEGRKDSRTRQDP